MILFNKKKHIRSQPQIKRVHGDRPSDTLNDGDVVCVHTPRRGSRHQMILQLNEKKLKADTILISWSSSWNSITFARKTTASEWVVQRLLCVLRSNDWCPPLSLLPAVWPCVRVVAVQRGRARGFRVGTVSLPSDCCWHKNW